ncbi:MAG TPA: aminotransferase class III-fold pyridoxal phosphate-dependent enzyme [Actinomycetota bacterium]|nr:aminotransferase class III-fold pyridoxal phosphate-dependent enzyme [Actinomycetota bacterium]
MTTERTGPDPGHDAVPEELTGVLTADPPRFDEDGVARIAGEVFGYEGAVERRFESERDQNFQLSDAEGGRRILKVSNAGERADVLDMEVGAALHARRTDPSLPIAEPFPTAVDPTVFIGTAVDDQNGARHMVRMYEHLPGRGSVDGLDLDHEAIWAYGETLARLGRALRGYFHPAADRVLLWNVEHCLALRPMTGAIEDASYRKIVRRVFDRFEEHVAPLWPGLRAQVVHGDLTLDNALLDDDGRITGIVDFGDMSHTALLADPVSALDSIPSIRRDDDLFRAAASLLDGYSSVTPLEPEERALVGDTLAARLALTVTISAWRVQRFPENARYIQSWDRNAWSMLEQFDELGTDETARRFGAPTPTPSTSDLIARRAEVFGTALAPLTYSTPLHLVRGDGPWLEDVDGRRYLDSYNNVPVVGHAHPRVANAIGEQARLLNTNLRYLHPKAIELAERLVASMPEGSGLDTVLFVNAGSEATDLAWRLAAISTENDGGLVTAHAYHGVTTATTALSPEEWRGDWRPDHVEPFTPPLEEADATGAPIREAIERLASRGHRPAALFLDTAYTSDGILAPGASYHAEIAEAAREAGALVVADEVQAGYGRTGEHLWSFVACGLLPDLVTLGKPMGNGHPVAAVIARRDDVDRLAGQAEFFSTFGGNPVAAAAGLAVLDVIRDEDLIARAASVGAHARAGLEALRGKHAAIAAVRGRGLLLGVELLRDDGEPARQLASRVLDGARDRGVIIGSTGRHSNVLKVRPPLVVGPAEADMIVAAIDDSLFTSSIG